MIFDAAYDSEVETKLAAAEAVLKPEIERRLHPSPDRIRDIAADWAIKHWWTDRECAALLMGADPDVNQCLTSPGLSSLVAAEDRQKFRRVLDYVQRRFGDRVSPADAIRWAGSISIGSMRNGLEMRAALEQALPNREVSKASVIKKCEREQSKVRQGDITKKGASAAIVLSELARQKGFSSDKKNVVVGMIKRGLEKSGINMDEQTIRDRLIEAEKYTATKISESGTEKQ
jgi:hypothetical protein